MRTLIQDLRYGARMLLKRPGFSLIAVITLALGIGANLTIFSFVDTMFLRPLPVREPYQLVTAGLGRDGGFAYPAYLHFRDHNKSFEALAAHYSTAPLSFAAPHGDSEILNGAVVSSNYFSTLGITPSLVLRLRPRLRDYSADKAQAFTKEVLSRLQAIPGVQSVSLSKTTLAWPGSSNPRVRLPEQTFSRAEDQLKVELHEIAPRLLETLKIPLISGRDFDDRDLPGRPRVAIVNETLAKRMCPDGQPVERPLIINEQSYRVVGVVKDAQFRNVAEAPQPFLYLPYWQNNLSPQIDATLMARVNGDPEAMLPILRREIAAVDSNVPINESATMSQQMDAEFKRVLLTSRVLISASAIALFLSMIGLYAALAFTVSQRTREIGIRMALGARTVEVLKLIVGQGLRLVFAGLAIGLLAAFAATRLMESLLYGVSATNPLTFVAITFALIVVALLACYIPARRATKVDPLVALRYE